jgi:hypothetical protein
MQELDIGSATIITRDESETLADNGRSVRILPFYHWAIEQGKN